MSGANRGKRRVCVTDSMGRESEMLSRFSYALDSREKNNLVKVLTAGNIFDKI